MNEAHLASEAAKPEKQLLVSDLVVRVLFVTPWPGARFPVFSVTSTSHIKQCLQHDQRVDAAAKSSIIRSAWPIVVPWARIA